ncbi:MAG: heparan-alpha-glucosaminide N-acetyltransferase domain-containing protein [Mycobacterium sp.]|uniref:heparan-alpha-glucosaminide N-acetyltransferase domain-containing protein n=1 Tax=Mycobacterium sp. TaxID=1785 RepID=UPI00261D5F4A|nr:heparan-alpha-glucosaminide N-acetyltransferase domain-containing protein [Mycobacterium sp.]MDI3316008.1 heparan-alpha-glucosaminide N-acetyltransferase domain-containing protein [Mycobacterium sp.]
MALEFARRIGLPGARPLATETDRLWPVDALRGAAVAGMVAYHFPWDLSFFGLYPADVTQGAWQVLARAGGSVFLLLVGLSMHLTAARRPTPPARGSGESGA